MNDPVSVPRITLPDHDGALERALAEGRPAVFVGAARAWTDLHAWAPRALAALLGSREVPVAQVAADGAVYDPRAGVSYRRIALDRYVASLEAGALDHYLSCSVRAYVPELLLALRPPSVVAGAAWRNERLWVAAKGQGGPLHIDLPHNLYVQLSGRKRFTLVSRWQSHRVYPHAPWSGVPNYARVDADAPDLAQHPRFRGAVRLHALLEPGDVLFIPSLDWHQARALETSVSINLWWADGWLARLARGAERFKRVRGLRL